MFYFKAVEYGTRIILLPKRTLKISVRWPYLFVAWPSTAHFMQTTSGSAAAFDTRPLLFHLHSLSLYFLQVFLI